MVFSGSHHTYQPMHLALSCTEHLSCELVTTSLQKRAPSWCHCPPCSAPIHLPDDYGCPLLPLSGFPLYLKVKSNLPKTLHSLVPGYPSNFIFHSSSSLLCSNHTHLLEMIKTHQMFQWFEQYFASTVPFSPLFKCLAPSYTFGFSLNLPSSERPLLIPAREDRLIPSPSWHSSFSLFHLHLSEIFFFCLPW